MTLTELLDRDEDRFVQELKAARHPAECEKACEEELDHILYSYNAGTSDDAGREAASYLVSEIRMTLPLLASGQSARLWESERTEEEKKKDKKGGKTLLFLIPAVILLAILAAMVLLSGDHPLRQLIVLALAAVLLFAAGRAKTLPAKKKDQKIELTVDAQGVLRVLRNALVLADENIKELSSSMQAGSVRTAPAVKEESGDLSPEELELFAGILSAELSKDGEAALDRAGDIRYFLHRRGYEAVSCDGTNENLFECMPGDRDRTIVPAILRDGKCVRRGRAVRRA